MAEEGQARRGRGEASRGNRVYRGLVERIRNPEDGRGVLAVLTPAGREAAEAGIAVLVERGFGLGGLTGQERVQLFGLLEKVRLGHGDFGLATQATQP